jgi:ABC-type multidrug transport system fused ATPase/permease subunit
MGPAGPAHERAQKHFFNRPGVGLIRALAVVEAVLIMLLLGLLGLMLALLTTRGIAEVRDPASVPAWLSPRIPPGAAGTVRLRDTGLTPIIIEKARPDTPFVHRAMATGLRKFVTALRPLRTNLSALALLMAASLATLLLAVWVGQWRRARVLDAAVRGASALRHQVHRQIYRLGQSALPNEGIGPVLNLFTREVNDVRDATIAALDASWKLPLLAVGLVLVALVMSWPVTVFLVSLIALCAVIAWPLLGAAREEATIAAREAALNTLLLQEDLGLVRTVRVFGMEGIDRDRFDAHLTAYTTADRRRLGSELAVQPALQLLAGVSLVCGLGLIGFAVLGVPDRPTSLAAALTVVLALGGLGWVLYRWRTAREVIRRGERSAATVFAYVDRRPELLMAPGAHFLAPLRERIALENVSLNDPAGRPILTGISAEIKAGTRTALVGLDEGAKQALVCLIPRLIDPSVGRVRIDGIDLKDVTLESIRAQVATVFQADLVISDSVFANIGLGDPSFGLARIVEAAKVAHIHHTIQDLPEGYETLLGPLGHYLSPDEQYRLALARVWLHDPSIVIIEESTTPLDDDIKPLVDDTIDRLSRGRTLIFLPHRLSTIRKCDRVLVLHNGRLEDQGTPRELQARSKLFRHIQYVEFNQFATGEMEAGQMEG